jgi:hypothetical protein
MTSDIQHILQMYSFYNCIPCCIQHSFTINTTVLLQSHYSHKAFLQISFKHNRIKNDKTDKVCDTEHCVFGP